MSKCFNLSGTDYPLEHLTSFLLEIAQKDPLAAAAVLRVTYSCHTYSQGWKEGQHDPAYLIEEDGEKRSFCPVRYGCSTELPTLLRYHSAGKAYAMRDGNGFLNNFFYAEADGVPYPVYFRLSKATRRSADADGILHIMSACQNPLLLSRGRYQSVKFARLVHQTCPPKPQDDSPSV